MKERPILFSAPMVRAILNGTKTQTRRVVKPVGNDEGFAMQDFGNGWWPYRSADGESPFYLDRNGYDQESRIVCPYGEPGDRLWVRETWRHIEGGAVYDASGGVIDAFDPETIYRADKPYAPGPWKPAIHMPRWACRTTLEVTGMRVERLQDISEADAKAEGIESLTYGGFTTYRNYSLTDEWAEVSPMLDCPIESYRTLWESINDPDAWVANPWVWVVSFQPIEAATSAADSL